MAKRKLTLLNDKAVLLTLEDDQLELLRQSIPVSATESEEACLNRKNGYPRDVLYRPSVVMAILTNVARGLTRAAAAELAGVGAGTLYQWTQKHPELAKSLACAEAICEERLLTVITNAFEKHPRLALEVLERRLPKEWAQHRHMEHSGGIAHGMFQGDWIRQLGEARLRREQEMEVRSGPALLRPATATDAAVAS